MPQGPPEWSPAADQQPAQQPADLGGADRSPAGPRRAPDRDTPPPAALRTPRLVGALAIVVVSLLTTAAVVAWIWNKADAVTPVDLPSASGSPLPTVNPSVKPTTPPPPPPPEGKYLGGFLINHLGDRMPKMPGVWEGQAGDPMGLRGGAFEQSLVHKDKTGKGIWYNGHSFGTLNTVLIKEYRGPANLRRMAVGQAGIMAGRLYEDFRGQPSQVTRRSLKVNGHQAFEWTGRIPIHEAKVPQEKFTILASVAIDRGDGTAAVAVAAIAGTQPAWLNVWRKQVQKILIAR